ncbi:hypothetical protein EMPS_07385 [Entomortierella parvispora]|uniref:Uncharacterized protein n=1 Tax=Entomortierella parvispora TaxID=205924 RepID=A0A9P3HE94_9FUNG|nr:hypothetical protein EMPS_07385 [Entomortierella parvispora]
MISSRACILLLVAMATAKADNYVHFHDDSGGVWSHVVNLSCTKFPNWFNDRSTDYANQWNKYTCYVFEHEDCIGRSAQLADTGYGWLPVPDVGGISSIKCFLANNN